MLDLHYILSNLDAIRENNRQRLVPVDMDRFVELADARKKAIQHIEDIRSRQNENARKMKGKLPQDERDALIEEGRQLKASVGSSEEELRQTELALRELQMQIPNLTHPDAPVGKTDEDNRVVKHWGEPRRFDFTPKDHVDIADALGLIDWEHAAKVTGSKFYFLRKEAVLLELALQRYALSILEEEGFESFTTPDLARREILEGIGFNPRGEGTQIYSVENTDLCLIATAEITLGGLYQDYIFSEQELPRLCAGISHCFRTEAGAAGRASRGLYRVHQFSKVEMFAFTTAEQSDATLEKFLAIEERIFQGLGIPYRVVDCCTGDLGGQAYRKYDVEAWMPGRTEGGSYGEVTSASNCTDYQARRLMIRYRKEDQKKPQIAHTLNGTAIAISRALVAILENYQEADGSVTIPPVLRAWVGKDKIVR